MPPDPLHHPARPGSVRVAAGQVGLQVVAVFQFQGGGLAACGAQGPFHFLRLGDEVGEIPATPGQEERGWRTLDIADWAGRFFVAARAQEAGGAWTGLSLPGSRTRRRRAGSRARRLRAARRLPASPCVRP